MTLCKNRGIKEVGAAILKRNVKPIRGKSVFQNEPMDGFMQVFSLFLINESSLCRQLFKLGVGRRHLKQESFRSY